MSVAFPGKTPDSGFRNLEKHSGTILNNYKPYL